MVVCRDVCFYRSSRLLEGIFIVIVLSQPSVEVVIPRAEHFAVSSFEGVKPTEQLGRVFEEFSFQISIGEEFVRKVSVFRNQFCFFSQGFKKWDQSLPLIGGIE